MKIKTKNVIISKGLKTSLFIINQFKKENKEFKRKAKILPLRYGKFFNAFFFLYVCIILYNKKTATPIRNIACKIFILITFYFFF